jgi:rRNA processing protein Gar1
MHQEEQFNPDHQLHSQTVDAQASDLRQIAGTPVFTADNARIGAIERVISESTGRRYLVIDPGIRRRQLGVDRLYVPETSVQSSAEDRLILETPLASLPAQEWAELPAEVGHS